MMRLRDIWLKSRALAFRLSRTNFPEISSLLRSAVRDCHPAFVDRVRPRIVLGCGNSRAAVVAIVGPLSTALFQVMFKGSGNSPVGTPALAWMRHTARGHTDQCAPRRGFRFLGLMHPVHQRRARILRLDLIGAIQKSEGARLPSIGAACVRAGSVF